MVRNENIPHVWSFDFQLNVECSNATSDTEVQTIISNIDDAIAQLVATSYIDLHKAGRCNFYTSSCLDNIPNAVIDSAIRHLPDNDESIADDGWNSLDELIADGIIPVNKKK